MLRDNLNVTMQRVAKSILRAEEVIRLPVIFPRAAHNILLLRMKLLLESWSDFRQMHMKKRWHPRTLPNRLRKQHCPAVTVPLTLRV